MRKIITIFFAINCWVLLSAFTVVGHRGDPLKEPEETWASFNSAFESGANYVELDLHVSKDNILVISHDRNLQRITGHDDIVSQTPWAQIKSFKQANGEPMHSLEDLFIAYQNRPQTKFLIETKKTKKGNPQNMETLLVALIQKYKMSNRIMFHSFSLSSLQALKTALPTVPRIFIASSLKKINFEVLATSTGINLPSSLVTADLIKQLHQLKQSVYVWDQMSEQAKQWNWLINLPIDGVVTNYPETGSYYQAQKAKAEIKATAFDGELLTLKNQISYENPYNLTLKKAEIKPLKKYHVSHIVTKNKLPYLQLGTNRFIPALGFNDLTDIPLTLPYLGQHVIINPVTQQVRTFQNPYTQTITNQEMRLGQVYQITAVQKTRQALWFKTAGVWVKASQVLIQFDSTTSGWRAYQRLPIIKRLATPDLISQLTPWLTGATRHLTNWRKVHFDQIIRQD